MSASEQIKFGESIVKTPPVYSPSEWHACEDHAWQGCLETSNCYAYALDQPNFHWAIPGHGFTKAKPPDVFDSYDTFFRDLTPAEHRERLIDGAQQDGLIAIKEPLQVAGYYSVALFFSEREDYGFHWYRQDADRTWSHKNGWRPVSNHDHEGQPILDPRQDKESIYSTLGSFFLVSLAGVQLQHNFLGNSSVS